MKENIEVDGSMGLPEEESAEKSAVVQERLEKGRGFGFEIAKFLGFKLVEPIGDGLFDIANQITGSS